MSKALDLLRRLASGDNRGDFFISNELLKEIEAALAQPEQTEQESVATKLESHQFTAFHVSADDFKKLQKLPTGTKIYTAPPKREPIEDGELEVWYSQHAWSMDKQEYMWGFRDAEKAYGIGGE